MLIDGEKWACDACIRGHRVSSCQHTDRPLSHINRKGRPVSQCPHCRGLRKARANHVKCECGAKPHSKADCKKKEPKKDSKSADEAAKSKQCCCSHGGRCTCSGKRDSALPAVPETGPVPSTKPTLPALKTPLNPLKPDVSGSPYRHKTRKEASRHSHPYSIPRSHTIHSFSDQHNHSTDSLPLPGTAPDPSPSPFHNPGPTDPLPLRRAVSEHGSPMPFDDLGPQVPPIDMPYQFSQTASPASMSFAPQSTGSAYNSDIDSLFEPANLSGPVDWSTFDICSPDAVTTSAFSQPASFTSYDFNNFTHPGLSRSNSGEMSETGDISPIAGISMPPGTQFQGYDVGSLPEFSDAEPFSFAPPSACLPDMQPPLIASTNADALDLDFFGSLPGPGGYGISPPVQNQPNIPPSQMKHGYPMPQNLPMNPNHNFTTTATTAQSASNQSYMAQAPTGTPNSIAEPAWLPTSYPLAASPVPMATPSQNQFPSYNHWSQ